MVPTTLCPLAVAEALPASSVVLLVAAVGLALAFEFVNGFHDTANAVATVIYTHTLPPRVAVVWSGLCNLAGVLVSNGAVAYTVLALLPAELVLHVGTGAGFAMIFALLTSAIVWNLGTWYLGLPASSSHTLVGSIMGVGLANAVLSGHGPAAGVNWHEVGKVFASLLISPVVGFVLAGAGLLGLKWIAGKSAALFQPPPKDAPPPWPIRGTLVLTCTGVSFAHGSNDGQKGMGLLVLILVAILPAEFALNLHAKADDLRRLEATAARVQPLLDGRAAAAAADPSAVAIRGQERPAAAGQVAAALAEPAPGTAAAPHGGPSPEVVDELSQYLQTDGKWSAATAGALAAANRDLVALVRDKASLRDIAPADRDRLRTDLYLVDQSLAKRVGTGQIPTPADRDLLADYHRQLDAATRYIPPWVKVAVALALGCGTMVGWKRIVTTVGEKIGKQHLSYAQGMSAEVVAMVTIGAADRFGLPVSTTHVLSSGIAGTMAANRSGLQASTLRNILLAWVLTLPVCVVLGALLFAAGLLVALSHAAAACGAGIAFTAVVLIGRRIARTVGGRRVGPGSPRSAPVA